MTARQSIIKFLYESSRPVAVHEIVIPRVSQTAVSARLREIARDGLVEGLRVEGKAFKVWRMVPNGAISGAMIDRAIPLTAQEQKLVWHYDAI